MQARVEASRCCLLASRSLNDPLEIARHSCGTEEPSGFDKIMSVESGEGRHNGKTESHTRGLSLRTASEINLHHGVFFLWKLTAVLQYKQMWIYIDYDIAFGVSLLSTQQTKRLRRVNERATILLTWVTRWDRQHLLPFVVLVFPSIYWSHFCCTPCWARVLEPFCTNHCIGCPNSLKPEWMSQNEGMSFPSRQSIWEVVVTQEKTRKYICFLWKSGKAWASMDGFFHRWFYTAHQMCDGSNAHCYQPQYFLRKPC